MVAALVDSVQSTAGCCLLDVHSDPDHNRSVITFAGSAAAVQRGAVALALASVSLLDLRGHTGVHPRIGALDVMPFVPLGETTMDTCVALARDVAAEVAGAARLPVYLYGEAAPPGSMRTLAGLRAGGFEALLTDGLREPPDFGPAAVHGTAGAVAIGARRPLVAFNLLLDSPDVAVARRVARAVRESSGGIPGVQALGLALASRGQAQVSMNLLNPGPDSIAVALSAVSRAAEDFGCRVVEAELVGLAPADALSRRPAADLPGLPDASRTIEARLALCDPPAG